jgi:hypothetical protein
MIMNTQQRRNLMIRYYQKHRLYPLHLINLPQVFYHFP